MANSADPDQLASSEAKMIWIYTVCKGKVYPGISGFSRTKAKTAVKWNFIKKEMW